MDTKQRRLSGRTDGSFRFEFEGRSMLARPGETLAAALIANGEYVLRTAEDDSSRGVLCGIGVCWECRCIVNGCPNTRVCMTQAQPGMTVRRQRGLDY